jgi:hypothetical protein
MKVVGERSPLPQGGRKHDPNKQHQIILPLPLVRDHSPWGEIKLRRAEFVGSYPVSRCGAPRFNRLFVESKVQVRGPVEVSLSLHNCCEIAFHQLGLTSLCLEIHF